MRHCLIVIIIITGGKLVASMMLSCVFQHVWVWYLILLPVQTDQRRLEWEWLCEDEISYLGGKRGWGMEERMWWSYGLLQNLLSVCLWSFKHFLCLTLPSHDLQPLSSASFLCNPLTRVTERQVQVTQSWCDEPEAKSSSIYTICRALLKRHSYLTPW